MTQPTDPTQTTSDPLKVQPAQAGAARKATAHTLADELRSLCALPTNGRPRCSAMAGLSRLGGQPLCVPCRAAAALEAKDAALREMLAWHDGPLQNVEHEAQGAARRLWTDEAAAVEAALAALALGQDGAA